MRIELFTPRAADLIGYIPSFLRDSDPRPAAAQFHERYAHGGGWHPMKGWSRLGGEVPRFQYPGDPPLSPLARLHFRGEVIYVLPHAWVVIEQPDGTFEISRMD